MRIISKYHDYYDSAMSLGQDLSVVYARTDIEYDTHRTNINNHPKVVNTIVQKVNDYKDKRDDSNLRFRNNGGGSITKDNNNYDFSMLYFIFCGELIPCLKIKKVNHFEPLNASKNHTQHFYAVEDAVDYFTKEKIDIEKPTSRWSRKKLIQFLNEKLNAKNYNLKEWAISEKIISCVIESDKITINPPLKEYEFFKKYDAFTAFQNLDMWISGTLTFPQNILVEVEDKYKIQAHGFDKLSFRKAPTKHIKK